MDGERVEQRSTPPGFFLRVRRLPEGALAGAGAYARLTVAADRPPVVVEQFDAQSASRVVFGFGDGWHEMEYNPATGRSWRWIERARRDPGARRGGARCGSDVDG